MKAQAMLEFLVMTAFALMVLVVSMYIYALSVSDASSAGDSFQANSICLRVASAIGSLASLDGNSTYAFSLPASLNSKTYTVRIISNSGLVRVDYGSSGVSCSLQTKNVTNSTGSTLFVVAHNATIMNNGGVITVVP